MSLNKSAKMKISFVIPCYNTGEVINEIINEIKVAVEKELMLQYEIILVNDCSPKKGTIDILRNAVNRNEHIILLDLAKNVGQPNAILAGCRMATGDFIMTSDDDGQTSLDKIGEFLSKLNDGYDVVCARYTARTQKSLMRRIGSMINRQMSKTLIPRPEGIYLSTIFMAKKYVVDEIIKYDQPYSYLSGLILRVTQNIGNVDMEQKDRQEGESGYTFRKLISLWLNGFTAFSIKPLRIVDFIGMAFAIGGFLLALVTIIRKLCFVDFAAGWSSTISILLVVSGLILVALGIMGEYIGRIYMCVNKTPQSVVKDVYISKNN